ncbi:MAG: methylated-DNA--[protein]-cysteine S-methyltransferase [Nocardioidaceae bacterium]
MNALSKMSRGSKRSAGSKPTAGDVFAALPVVDEEAMRRLHDKLETAAENDGVLDIAYRTIDTPVGSLLLAATELGLMRVAYDGQGHDKVLAELALKVSPRILKTPARLDTVAREVDEYFAGARRGFDVPLDFRLAKGFRLDVLTHVAEIDYGKTQSYAEVAVAVGSPNAVRAVGTACATNPLPIVVPCHRVVRSDGSFGGYAGGPEAKRALLTLETAA